MTKESLSHKSGIYKITNTINQKIYVGSSVNLKKRFNTHINSLIKNTHHSKTMQRAYNKYGKDSFIFEVVELVELKENLLIREQYYMDELNPFGDNGFNNERIAGSKLGFKHTEETKKKMSESAKIYSKEISERMKKLHTGKKMLNETKEKISKKLKGCKRNEDFKNKMSNI